MATELLLIAASLTRKIMHVEEQLMGKQCLLEAYVVGVSNQSTSLMMPGWFTSPSVLI